MWWQCVLIRARSIQNATPCWPTGQVGLARSFLRLLRLLAKFVTLTFEFCCEEGLIMQRLLSVTSFTSLSGGSWQSAEVVKIND